MGRINYEIWLDQYHDYKKSCPTYTDDEEEDEELEPEGEDDDE